MTSSFRFHQFRRLWRPLGAISVFACALVALTSAPPDAIAKKASQETASPSESTASKNKNEDGAQQNPSQASTASVHPDVRGMKCAACHTPDGWTPASFAHDRTGYPLKGQHARAACTECHTRSWTAPVPQNCAGCHSDPHVQEFGSMCHSCHTEDNWQALFTVEAHRRSQFPLSGRHALLPCQECHIEKRERTFTRTALSCAACHAKDARSASLVTLDHATLSTDCRSCHSPVSFQPARFVEHSACFPLVGSTHAAIRCADCHQGNTLAGVQWQGSCGGNSVLKCAECHAHAKEITDQQHLDVAGYTHSSSRCVNCHRSGR